MSYVDETIQIVVPQRDDDYHEDTFAVVVAQRNAVIKSPMYLASAIRQSVASWIRETADGRDAMERACGDFNAGDLDQYWDALPLKEYFAKNSVELLSYAVSTSVCTGWEYDDVLWDRDNPLPPLGES